MQGGAPILGNHYLAGEIRMLNNVKSLLGGSSHLLSGLYPVD